MGYGAAGFGSTADHFARYQLALRRGDTATATLLEQQAYAHTQQAIPDRLTWQGIYDKIEALKAPAAITLPVGKMPGLIPLQPAPVVYQPAPPVVKGPAVVPPVLTPDVTGPATGGAPGGATGGGSGAPVPGAGGSGSLADFFGSLGGASAGGDTGLASFIKQPAVLIGLALLGFWALRRGAGTRRY